jgi:lycopene cyclase domain-containing protein
MPEKFTYLLVDFFCVLFPFAFSFHPKIKFNKAWRYFTTPCLLTALFFIIWDIVFTRIGVWNFNPEYLVGICLLGLPIEEYLFFICIPFACVFTWYCIHTFYNFNAYSIARMITILLILFLVVVASLHLPVLYTSVTFLFLAGLLALLLISKVTFLPSFYVSFLIILVPFFISNGILTGYFTQQPVVIYNDHYNLGLRMLSIPFEDTFYGMLLMLMNVAGFDYLTTKKTIVNSAVTMVPTEKAG